MILKYEPDIIINTGVAGSLSTDLRIGDIVISDGVVQHDYDASPIGIPPGMISGINLIKVPCNEELVKKLVQAAQVLKDTNVAAGTVASGDQFICSKEKKDCIATTFDALCVEMEGAAIGHACYINKVDFCIIRAMSDMADGSAHMDFDTFVEIAVEKTILIIKNFLRQI
jgi:adenosylhomocysteine nucleosidase